VSNGQLGQEGKVEGEYDSRFCAQFAMAQYVYTMRRVGKIVPPKRAILKDISLSFFPGAKTRKKTWHR
jgi:hypothetical protein